MPQQPSLIEGLDPTPLAAISAAQLLQMVQYSRPIAPSAVLSRNGLAFIIHGPYDPTPFIALNPDYARSLWIDTSVSTSTPTVKTYDDVSGTWVAWNPGLNSIGTDQIQDGAVTPIKIAPGANNTFLQTDGSGNVVWAAYNLGNGTVGLINLALGAANQFIRMASDGSAWQYYTFNISDFLTSNSIPLDAIIPAGNPGDIVQVNTDGISWLMTSINNAIVNGTLPVNKLVPGGAETILASIGGIAQWVSGSTLAPYVAAGFTHGRFIEIGNRGASPGVLVTGTFAVPSGVYVIDLEVVGGGGGSSVVGNKLGGGGGGYTRKILTVTPGDTYDYQVGFGGASAVVGAPDNGGDTIFDVGGTEVIGEGGVANGAGGSHSGGDTDYGRDGALGLALATAGFADSVFGQSGYPLGRACNYSAAGVGVESLYGGGGFGSTALFADPHGAPGILIITY